jgi:hypothetical protein
MLPRREFARRPNPILHRVTAETKQPSRAHQIVAGSRNIALFFIALFSVGAIQSRSITVPESSSLGRKWQHISERGAQYTLLYVGSSRVVHHFISEQFDAALKEQGHDAKSFNFGQDGMFPPESLYVLRKLLEKTPVRPRWVLIDLMEFTPVLAKNEYSERAIAWHDLHYTSRTLQTIWSEPGSFSVRLGESVYHAGLLAQRTIGVGRGQEPLQLRLKLVQPRKPPVILNAGYEPLDARPLMGAEKDKFHAGLAGLQKSSKQVELSAPYRAELEQIIALVRSHGAVPVFIVAPVANSEQRFKDWPPADVAQFSYDYPETYPTLYLPDQRYDAEHLDSAGAKEFTRIFATEFADWLKRK